MIWSTHGLLGLAHLIMMMVMMVTHGSLFSLLFHGMVTQKVWLLFFVNICLNVSKMEDRKRKWVSGLSLSKNNLLYCN